MMRNIVELMISFMKGQEIHIGFKERCNKREILRSLIPQEEETSTLAVDLEEEDEEEAWVEVEVRSFLITAHIQDNGKGLSKHLYHLHSLQVI